MDRRSYLTASFGALATLSFGGVSSAKMDQEESDDEGGSTEQEDSDRKYVRGERDVDLSTKVVEDDEHVEYLEEEGTVRFPIGMSGDEPVGFETKPWEEWAAMQSARPAAREASDYLEREHGIEVGGGISGKDGELIATINFSKEEYTLDEIVPLTPSSVTVTYYLGDRKYESDVPIFVWGIGEVEILTTDINTPQTESSSDGADNATATGNNSQQGTDESAETEDEREHTETATDSDTGEETSSDGADEDREDDESGPGFGVSGAIAGLTTVGYLLGRRVSDAENHSE